MNPKIRNENRKHITCTQTHKYICINDGKKGCKMDLTISTVSRTRTDVLLLFWFDAISEKYIQFLG